MKTNNTNWKKEWTNMPFFHVPTRDTELRNKYDISDVVEYNRNTPTTMFPRYPIYVISKGRYEKRKTCDALDRLNIDYKLVVEPQEFGKYSEHVSKERILVLPFSNLNQGSIPARNWVLEHALKNNTGKHWILDDNLSGFGTQKYGRRVNTSCGDFFAQCENFVDRYKNIAMAGIRYRFHHNYTKTPYLLNTRIYSCILIDNSIEQRWRGTYNEDTDLSIRILKEGHCTMLFTWCYCNKVTTMSMKGGNTDKLYAGEGRRLMAESLREQHPDIVKVSWKWKRWQHQVNYAGFKNKLQKLDKQ